ncbi:MAG: hypothetical protein JO064_11465 [Actinobacteria bacterium]|nr:hypothetical protein [Actinomycetota bacterium]
MRSLAVAVGCAALFAFPGLASAAKPLLGVTGNTERFLEQTTQDSLVDEAFLGWGQGQSYGAPFQVLFSSLTPIPMIHLGTFAEGNKKEAITPAAIAAGSGDGYLLGLNAAISQWGKAIYVRPMAEMNNAGNIWSGYDANGNPKPGHTPADYRKAFARIYLIVHGGPIGTINAKLRALGMPGVRGGDLPQNPFPRVRVLWSPLAGGNPKVSGNSFDQYWPGNAYVDVGGGDIFDEQGSTPPWTELAAIHDFVVAHGKPFSIPEWGIFGFDDPDFFTTMCTFIKDHPQTETAEFFESKPGAEFDLQSAPDKPLSRKVYKHCIAPQNGSLPPWAANAPGNARQLTLKLVPDPTSGPSPLDVEFSIIAKLSVPIVEWQVVFGDGSQQQGSGTPPTTITHTYKVDGVYQATLVVYQAPPFTGTAIRFLTSATVTAGQGAAPLISLKTTPTSGKTPLKVVFQIDTNLPRPITTWQVIWGDGNYPQQGTGRPPHFTGHTYEKAGTYNAILIVYESPPFTGTVVRFYTASTITVT